MNEETCIREMLQGIRNCCQHIMLKITGTIATKQLLKNNCGQENVASSN